MSFEIFGYDFMIDENIKPFLIEINSNPCIEIISSNIIDKIIPNMIDNAFRIVLDPIFPPPEFNPPKKITNPYHFNNKFSLIFDEIVDGKKF